MAHLVRWFLPQDGGHKREEDYPSMKTITVVIEYEREEYTPLFHAGMKVKFGGGRMGTIIAVVFTDILKAEKGAVEIPA